MQRSIAVNLNFGFQPLLQSIYIEFRKAGIGFTAFWTGGNGACSHSVFLLLMFM